MSWRTLAILGAVALLLILLAFAMGAEAGPDCWKKGLKLC